MNMARLSASVALALGFAIVACRSSGSSSGNAAANSAAATASTTASVAHDATIPSVAAWAPASVEKRAAPKAPAREQAPACKAAPAGTKRVYDNANGNDCAMRGGAVQVIDTPELRAAGRHPVSICRDDDCTSDTSCGTDKICLCGKPGGSQADHNRCAFGNCTSDADCGGFACVETLALGIPSQPSGVSGVLGSYCRSKADTCNKDADCTGTTGARCIFAGGAFHCAMPR